jgi:hypothetical protein
MGAREIVDYIINLGGNVRPQVDAHIAALKRLGDEAGKTAKSLNNSAGLAMFETLASLLTQVGGSTAQVGIIASSAARPVAVLSKMFGASGVAAVAMGAGLTIALAATVKLFSATNEWIGSMTKVRKELIDQGYLTSASAQGLVDYEKAATRLSVATDKLSVTVADALAPSFTEATNAGTGFFRWLDKLAQKGVELNKTYGELGEKLLYMNPVGAALLEQVGGSLADAGATNDTRVAKVKGARDLLAPLPEIRGEQMLAITQKMNFAPGFQGPILPQAEIDAAGVEKKREQERNREAGERLQEQIDAAYEAMLEATRETLQKIAEAETKLMLQDLDAAAKAATEARRAREEQARIDAKDTADLAAYEQQRKAASQQSQATFASAFTGADVGSIASSAGGGPWGAVFGAVASGAARDQLQGLFDQVDEIYKDLPKEIGKLASDLVPSLIRAAPEMAAAFTVIGPAVVKELILAAPEIFAALLDALQDLPRAFAEAISDALSVEIGGREVGLGNLDTDGGAGRTIGGAAAGFLVGGPVGAVVGGAIGGLTGGGKNKKNGGGGNGITINNVTAPNARSLMRELRQLQGSYGYGESLDPVTL